MYIGVAGNIGAGKTTLAHMISDHFNFPLLEESVVDNPYLDKYYDDIPRWAFQTQLYFVTSRVKTFIENQKKHNRGVLDRVLAEDKYIFTTYLHQQGHLSNDDFKLYNDFFELQTNLMKPLSLLVYIQSDVSRLKENIEKRNRSYEQELLLPENTYLADLNQLYENWISSYSDSPLLIIDSNRDNVIEDKEKRKKIVQEISSYLI